MQTSTPPLLMSPREAARFSGIGANTLREMVKVGKLDHCMVGSHVRIKTKALLSLIEDGLPQYTKGRKPAQAKPRRGDK